MRRLIVLLIAFVPFMAMGQNYHTLGQKPCWLDGYSRDLNNSYIEVVSAFDYDLDGAKKKAIKEIGRRRNLATGAEVSISGQNVTLGERNLIVKARIVDEYVQHTTNGYTVHLLVQTAKNPTYPYESVTVSNEYDFSARAFIPGMAQIYKGTKVKGYSIIAAQALSVAGIIMAENQRASYVKKMKEQPRFIKEYNTKADNWETGRNICIGVAAGIWVYNLIDAAVAKGAHRVLVKRADGSSLSVRPMATPYGAGASLAFRF